MKCAVSSNIEVTLRDCFSQDEALLSTYHVDAGKGLDACVARTYEDLLKAHNYTFYTVTEQDTSVGYFGMEDFGTFRSLMGFFINPSFRPRKNEFWSLVKSTIGNDYLIGVYNKNTPAIRFLEKMGCEKHCEVEGGVFYRYTENLCQ